MSMRGAVYSQAPDMISLVRSPKALHAVGEKKTLAAAILH